MTTKKIKDYITTVYPKKRTYDVKTYNIKIRNIYALFKNTKNDEKLNEMIDHTKKYYQFIIPGGFFIRLKQFDNGYMPFEFRKENILKCVKQCLIM